jgi:hypothetical protein
VRWEYVDVVSYLSYPILSPSLSIHSAPLSADKHGEMLEEDKCRR